MFDAAYPNHQQLSNHIHALNVEAGWWTNLETGEPLARNFGEMLALVHSELTECWEGVASKSFDDHLPAFPQYRVELADACIRVYDMLGGLFSELPAFLGATLDVPEGFISVEDRLVYLHALLSRSLEYYRHSDHLSCKRFLYQFLDSCFEWAHDDDFDLLEILKTKLAYNRDRLDHKLENRIKDDGKKI